MHPGVAHLQQRAFGRGFLRALGVVCALLATLAHAQTVTKWTGSGTTWATNGNWSNNAPVAGGIAQFDSSFTGSNNPTGPNSNTTIGGLYFTSSLGKGVTINNGTATLTLSSTTINGNTGTAIDDSSGQAIVINQSLALNASAFIRSTSATAGSLTIGGTLNLNGNTATVNAGASAPITFSGVISGTGGITAGGPGTVTLSNTANTYTGVTTINGGILSALVLANSGTNSSIGKSSNAATNLVINGGTLQYTGAAATTNRLFTIGTSGATLDASGSGALTFSNTGSLALSTTTGNRTLTLTGTNTGNNTLTAVIGNPTNSGATSVTKSGAGTWVLANSANTYTGATTINGGTLSVVTLANSGSNSSIGKSSNAASNLVINGGTLKYTGAAATTNRLFTIGTSGATLDASGSGALTFSNTGNLALASTTASTTLTLTGTNTGANTLASNIVNPSSSGTTSLVKNGSGTWVLSGTGSTYSGSTQIQAGTLRAGGANTLSANSAVVLTNTTGATLDLNSNNNTVGSLAGGGSSGGNVTLGGGTLTAGGDNTSTSFAGVISGTGGLTKAGTGTMTLSNTANTYSGATTINSGTLSVGTLAAGGTNSSIGASTNAASNLVINGGTLQYTGAAATTNRLFTIGSSGATVDASGSGALTFSNTGNLALASTTASTSLTLTGTSTAANTLASNIVNPSSSGTTSLVKNGSGTWVLSGTGSTYSGSTQIQAGTLRAGGANTLSANSAVVLTNTTGATLDLNGNNNTIGSLAGGGTSGGNVTLLGGTLTAGGNNTSTTYAGVISGTGGLTKTGTGTMTLSGTNTFTGTTQISAGTLQAGSAGALSSSSAVVLTNTTGAALDLNNNNLSVGSIAGGGTSGGNVTLGTGTLTVGGDNTSTAFNGTISGTGGLVKNGSGTLTVGGNNSYSGGTTINLGTLKLGAAGSAGNGPLGTTGGSTTVNSGGALDLNGITLTNAEALSVNGSGVSSIGALTNSNATAASYSGAVTLAGNASIGGTGDVTLTGGLSDGGTARTLTKVGTDTLNLNAAGTLTSGNNVVVNGGTVALGASNALGSSALSNVTVNATTAGTTATFAVGSSVSQSIASLTLGGAGGTSTSTNNVTIGSSGTLALGGNVTYDATNNPLGSTISGSGTLNLGSSVRTFNVGDSSNATSDLTVSSVISGTGNASGGLTKTGNGTLTLSGANTFTGEVNVNAGTLAASGTTNLGGFAALGDHSWVAGPTSTTVVTVANGATLSVSSSNVSGAGSNNTQLYQTLSLSGTGNNGGGALRATGGTNTWLGNVSLAGDTQITNAASGATNALFLGPYTTASPTSFLLNNHTLTFTGSGTTYVNASVGNSSGDTGSVVINVDPTTGYVGYLGPRNYYTGTTTIVSGNLYSAVYDGNNANAAILGNLTIGTGTGSANTAVLLEKYADQITDSVSVTINKDGKLDLGTYGTSDTVGALTLNGGHIALSGASGGSIFFGADVHVTGGLASTIDGSATSNAFLNSRDLGVAASSRTFTVDAGSSLLLGVVMDDRGITGTDSLIKDGGGTMTITSDNSFGYYGITHVKNGILNIQNVNALGQYSAGVSEGTVVDSGGTLQLQGNIALQGETLKITGTGYSGTGALDSVSGSNTWGGAITIGDDARIQSDSGQLGIYGGVTIDSAATNASHTLTVGGAANTLIRGNLNDGSGGSQVLNLTKVDSGTLTLSTTTGYSNTFSGAINVDGGTLSVNADNALASHVNTVDIASSATFAVSGGSNYTNTIAAVTGTGTVSIAGSTNLVVNNSAHDTFGGTITGSGLFQKTGSGTLTFSSTANTSSFYFNGTVELASNSTMEFQGGTGTKAVSTNALFINTLKLDTGTLLLTNAYINVGTLIITGNTILDFGTGGASVLNASNIYIAAGVTLTIKNWSSEVDYLFATNSSYATSGGFRLTDSNGNLAVFNSIGSTPENQVDFQGDPQSPDGSHTTWINSGFDGYTNWEIRPIPEPSTYGACFLGGCLALLGWRRYRRTHGSNKR